MSVTVAPPSAASPVAHKQRPPSRKHRGPPLLVWGVVVLLILIGAGIVVMRLRAARIIRYMTQPVVRQNLVESVTAAGTVNPQNLILVGTQVSGTIAELDVDYNSAVNVGQVLAKLDPTTFRDTLAQAAASQAQYRNLYAAGVAAAQTADRNVAMERQTAVAGYAALASSVSQVAKARTALALARLTLRRDRALLGSGFLAQNQYDSDASSQVAATAALDAATLAVDGARAQAAAQDRAVDAGSAQSRSASATARAQQSAIGVYDAQVAVASYNLRQSVIVSPVRGTVIARNISVGQTVAASFTTPTLFTIAQDLSKMEVDIAVGEPDVGGIRAGETADFTVLAFPNRTFHGRVYAVRRNPTTVNNVVTYATVVDINNADGALYPGMTASASIHVAQATAALVVPLEALVWTPVPASANASVSSSPWGMTTAALSRTVMAGRNGRVFVLEKNTPRAVDVRIVLVSGTQAAVAPLAGSLNPNDVVVTSDSTRLAAMKSVAPAKGSAQSAAVPRAATR